MIYEEGISGRCVRKALMKVKQAVNVRFYLG